MHASSCKCANPLVMGLTTTVNSRTLPFSMSKHCHPFRFFGCDLSLLAYNNVMFLGSVVLVFTPLHASSALFRFPLSGVPTRRSDSYQPNLTFAEIARCVFFRCPLLHVYNYGKRKDPRGPATQPSLSTALLIVTFAPSGSTEMS